MIERLNTALAGRYHVERVLGEGGMATVFLARDLRHNRSVALKVLKPELAAAIGAERFLAEIETTANLQHPHILPLHDSGDAAGLLYYTMPYVEGDTLRQRLDRERSLPIDDAIRLVIDVADALEAAHERGVVHRDIKPSNILLSRGKALVADFGIARAATSDATRMTQLGVVIGTAGYMSPEQASGSGEIDARSDVYSLACMLFEMLAGEPPFVGRTILQVLAKQATEEAPSVCLRRPEVPAGVARSVATALAREPGRRFQTAAAFATALDAARAERSTGVAPPAPPRPAAPRAVVVLPFVNRSADPDNEYFSDGLTDEVISDLARVSALRVISRNSAMALKGTTKDTATLARELGITHLVTGTVRRAGPALRVTAELVDAATDSPIWAEKFSGTMEDVFGIQEDISRQIVAALKVTLTTTEDHGVAARPIDDPLAYDFYLRACHVMFEWTPDAQRHAVRLIDEAIAISGDAPLLLAMKGQLEWNKVNIPMDPALQVTGSPRELAERALACAEELVERALALDADCHLAIFVRGLVAGARGRPEAGLLDLHRAHQLRPADANVIVELNRYALAAGIDCKAWVDELFAIDPLTPQTHLMFAMYHDFFGPVESVAAPARRSIELAPDASLLRVSAAWWLAIVGQRAEAIDVLDRVRAAAPDDLRGQFATFLRCAFAGDAAGARSAASREMESSISNEYIALMMACGYALLGVADNAMRSLRRAVELGFINHPVLATNRMLLDCLGDEPAFHALLAEIEPRWRAVVEWHRGLSGEDARTLLAKPT